MRCKYSRNSFLCNVLRIAERIELNALLMPNPTVTTYPPDLHVTNNPRHFPQKRQRHPIHTRIPTFLSSVPYRYSHFSRAYFQIVISCGLRPLCEQKVRLSIREQGSNKVSQYSSWIPYRSPLDADGVSLTYRISP